jgi:sulfatase modifying factor 1
MRLMATRTTTPLCRLAGMAQRRMLNGPDCGCRLNWNGKRAHRGVDGREYPWGNAWDVSKCCNYPSKGGERTYSVQSYPKGCSTWGLYQMSGNIWEWCEDWYDSEAYNRYRQGELSSPEEVGCRVLRGGSWGSNDPKAFRGAYRGLNGPDIRNVDCGFRLDRTVTL